MPREIAPGFMIERDARTGEDYIEVPVRGELLIDFPMFNKGTAFTQDERDSLGLQGLLPPRVVTMEQQVARVVDNYARKTSDLERYIHLISLLDRNETLFYRVLVDRLEELLPIVYTPTVGLACQQFARIFRRSRGIYLTPEDTGRVDEILSHWPFSDVRIIVVTDGQRVLGLGDLGANSMGIPIGKLSLYVAGAGIHPAGTLPVCLDVGTDNDTLLADPLYLGKPRRRVRGADYDGLVAAFMEGVAKRWPRALVQFEDFGIGNAFRLLDFYRDRACCFNDDIQGTGAVTLAGVLAGLRIINGRAGADGAGGGELAGQKVFIAGAGGAGIGIARALEGAQIWVFDSNGLLTADRRDSLLDFQKPWARAEAGGSLEEVARRVCPTVLIGVAGRPDLFTRELLGAMEGPRPLVFPLSNPTSKAECTPEQARAWTDGRALVATGSPFPDTAQCNNMYIFPGIGLGAACSGATRITNRMFTVAAQALAAMTPEGALYPRLSEVRRISVAIALAVGKEAVSAGLAEPLGEDDLRERIASTMWEPRYLPYRAAPDALSRAEALRHEVP